MFRFPDPEEVAPPLLGFNDVTFSYPGSSRVIFREVNFGEGGGLAPTWFRLRRASAITGGERV